MATNKPRLPGENNDAEQREDHAAPKGLRGIYTELAIRSGAMTDAGELSEEMVRFATLVAEHCAGIAEAAAGQGAGDRSGERIRAALLD